MFLRLLSMLFEGAQGEHHTIYHFLLTGSKWKELWRAQNYRWFVLRCASPHINPKIFYRSSLLKVRFDILQAISCWFVMYVCVYWWPYFIYIYMAEQYVSMHLCYEVSCPPPKVVILPTTEEGDPVNCSRHTGTQEGSAGALMVLSSTHNLANSTTVPLAAMGASRKSPLVSAYYE